MQSSTRNPYRILVGLFSALFIGSVIFNYIDLKASYEEYRHLEYPAWLVHPLCLAKVLGIIVILRSKSQSLKDFAYTGFLFDLLCALGGHIAQQEIKFLLPLASIVLWAFTYRADRRYHEIA